MIFNSVDSRSRSFRAKMSTNEIQIKKPSKLCPRVKFSVDPNDLDLASTGKGDVNKLSRFKVDKVAKSFSPDQNEKGEVAMPVTPEICPSSPEANSAHTTYLNSC